MFLRVHPPPLPEYYKYFESEGKEIKVYCHKDIHILLITFNKTLRMFLSKHVFCSKVYILIRFEECIYTLIYLKGRVPSC